jgi:hypothetical protein
MTAALAAWRPAPPAALAVITSEPDVATMTAATAMGFVDRAACMLTPSLNAAVDAGNTTTAGH